MALLFLENKMSEKVRVICTRPGAGPVINGVNFPEVEPGVRLSDEVTREQAEVFCELSGFEIDGEQSVAQSVVEATEPVVEEEKPAPAPTPAPKPPAPTKKAAKPSAVAPAPEKAPVLPADTDEAF